MRGFFFSVVYFWPDLSPNQIFFKISHEPETLWTLQLLSQIGDLISFTACTSNNLTKRSNLRTAAGGSHGQFRQQIFSEQEHNISQFCCYRMDPPGHCPKPVVWQLTEKWTAESLQLLKKKKKKVLQAFSTQSREVELRKLLSISR